MAVKKRYVTHEWRLYWVQDETTLDPEESVRCVVLRSKYKLMEGNGYTILAERRVKFRQVFHGRYN